MSNAQDYTIGCICALPTEVVALRSFLDEAHPPLTWIAKEDHNAYTLGRIGRHNVVIAGLPGEPGIASAAGVAKDMLHTFTNLRIGLMVGIGGGAPTTGKDRDIRLGDVVVSTPGHGHGGVFQYDFGKSVQDREFQRTGFLDQPPELLRATLAAIRADFEIRSPSLDDMVNKSLEKNKRLREKYTRPSESLDILYSSTFTHPSDKNGNSVSCTDRCSHGLASIVPRPDRTAEDDDPAIHFGLIASANQLMKDAKLRDDFADKFGVLCFDMEAAGLMNRFPCLVVRGIANYADTHKNDCWQGYAAMTAAAFAKVFICRVTPIRVGDERAVVRIRGSEDFVESERNRAQGCILGERRRQSTTMLCNGSYAQDTMLSSVAQ